MKHKQTLTTWLFTTKSNRAGDNRVPFLRKTMHGPREHPFSYPTLLSSKDCFDHLWWGFGPRLHKMLASGDMKFWTDTVYSSELKVVESVDMSVDLRLFACKCCLEMPIGEGRVFSDTFPDPAYLEYVYAVEKFAKGKSSRSKAEQAKDKVAIFIYSRDKATKDISIVFEYLQDSFVASLMHENPVEAAADTCARILFCAPKEYRPTSISWARDCFYNIINSRFKSGIST